MKPLTTLLLTLLVLGGCSGEAKFEQECSLTGLGKFECEVRNIGTEKGSVCLRAELLKLDWRETFRREINVKENEWQTPSNKLCTNLIEPMDMQKKSKTLYFYDDSGDSYLPWHLCSLEESLNWDEGCMWFTEEVQDK